MKASKLAAALGTSGAVAADADRPAATSDPGAQGRYVRQLRAKVDYPYPRSLIHTVRGVGYVLEERD